MTRVEVEMISFGVLTQPLFNFVCVPEGWWDGRHCVTCPPASSRPLGSPPCSPATCMYITGDLQREKGLPCAATWLRPYFIRVYHPDLQLFLLMCFVNLTESLCAVQVHHQPQHMSCMSHKGLAIRWRKETTPGPV